MEMPRAFLFDFDGTLADTEPLHFAAFAETLTRRGVAISETEYFAHFLGRTDRECIEWLSADRGRADLVRDREALVAEKARVMASRLRAGAPLRPGVREFVARAAEAGPAAVVSGALRVEVESVLAGAELGAYFATIVAADDVSRGKPDPEGFRLAWRRLRALRLADLEPRECLAIEDAPHGITAARAAGMRVLAVAGSCRPEALAEADLVVPSLAEFDWKRLGSAGAELSHHHR